MFNKKFNSGKKFGQGGGGRDRDSGPTQMHRTNCAECGQSCEVPFKPTGSRPVFCRDCFQQQGDDGGDDRGGKKRFSGGRDRDFGGGRGGRDFGGGRDSGRDFEEKQLFEAVCATCHNRCTVPFKPQFGRDLYCRDCMDKKNSPRAAEVTAEQFQALSDKVDKILKLLQGNKTHVVTKEEQMDLVEAPKEVKAKASKAKGEPKAEPAPKKKPTRAQVKRAIRTGRTL